MLGSIGPHDVPGRATMTPSGLFDVSRQWRRVQYGPDALDRLSGELDLLGIRRPLIVTTHSVATQDSLMATIHDALGRRPADMFAACRPHSPFPVARAAADAAAASGADGMVSIGGGSCTDTAKAALVSLGCAFDDAAAVGRHRLHSLDMALAPELPWRSEPLPLVALPTTLAGAELLCSAGITDPDRKTKYLLMNPALAPRSVILDPRLALATPDRLWVATGVKSFSDAFEQVTSLHTNPVVAGLSLGAIELFAKSLPLSVTAGSERRVARLDCQVAVWMTYFGTLSSAISLGIGSALRHQLGSYYGVAHGEATCVLLPHVLAFNLPATLGVQERLAAAVGVRAAGDDPEALGLAVVERVKELLGSLDVPTTLRDLGIADEGGFDELAVRAMDEPSVATNPRRVEGPEDVAGLLKAAL
jgi:alcohol dehydrogenase class IV